MAMSLISLQSCWSVVDAPWPASAAGATLSAQLYLALFGAVSATAVHS